jgi:hypothetical protein
MVRALVSALLLLPTTALAAPIPVKAATASSTFTEQGTWTPDRAADGKLGTAWVEGDAGAGLGAWLELDLGGEQQVHRIRLWGGDWRSWDEWQHANRPKEVELKFSDGSTQTVTLKDEKVAQTFDLGGKTTSSIRLKLKSTYSGTAWLDTGIAEVQLLGTEEGEKASASSIHAEDGDGNYLAANVLDGLADSMWCEGVAGDGTGQWLDVDFGRPRTVSKLQLINGIGSSLVLWLKANTATGLELRFPDGTTEALAIPSPSFRPTELSFAPRTTQKVRIVVTGVKKGKEFDDLCFSEIRFSG